MNNKNVLWVEKYRPQQFTQIAYHDKIINLLSHFIKNHSLPHLFFYGPAGTGKTSTIVSLTKEIYGKHYKQMVIHLNASDNRGQEYIQKEIVDFISTKGLFVSFPYKMVIMDEADSMSRESQILLKDIINSENVRFCLIGNYQHALIPELCSNTLKLLFPPIPPEIIYTVATNILTQEGYTCEPECLEYIYSINGGDLRKYINTLQSVCLRNEDKHIALDFIKTFLKQFSLTNFEYFMELLNSPNYNLLDVFTDIKKSLLERSQDFMWWMNKVSQLFIEVLDNEHLVLFCKQSADLEYNSSFIVNYDIQLFAFISLCKEYSKFVEM